MQSKTPIDIFDEIRKLNFPAGHYIVIGSGIMAVKGIRPAYDLDVVVSPELFESCKGSGWELMPWTRSGRPGKEWLKGAGADLMLEIWSAEKSFSLADLLEEAEVVENIPFLSVPQLIRFKKEYGRPKDFEDIEILERYLRAQGEV